VELNTFYSGKFRKLFEETQGNFLYGNFRGNFRKPNPHNIPKPLKILTVNLGNFPCKLQRFPHPPFRGRKQETFNLLMCLWTEPRRRVDGGKNKQGLTMQIELTNEMILDDIAEFQNRIKSAREILAELPTGYLTYPENKNREKQRRDLEAEIRHVQKMMGYAQEALEEVTQ
jgi:hypothetical protein